jgi:enterobactin synthetase component D
LERVSPQTRIAADQLGHNLRRREWVATRFLSQYLTGQEPVSGHYGEPLWSGGLVGSITHKQGHVALWTGIAEDGFGGIDMELCRPFADGLVDKFADERERYMLQTTQDGGPLIFSAKESIYKALFPMVRKKFWFDAVRLENVCVAGASGVLDFRLMYDLSAVVHEGERLRVYARRICIDKADYWLTALRVRCRSGYV